MISEAMTSGVVALRPFVPAKDYSQSRAFYQALGFQMTGLGDGLSHMQLGAFGFLLQDYYVREFAENLMMHLLVRDLDAWWEHISRLDLAGRFAVAAPKAPELQPWGLRVGYVFDPAGVLWHIAEDAAG